MKQAMHPRLRDIGQKGPKLGKKGNFQNHFQPLVITIKCANKRYVTRLYLKKGQKTLFLSCVWDQGGPK